MQSARDVVAAASVLVGVGEFGEQTALGRARAGAASAPAPQDERDADGDHRAGERSATYTQYAWKLAATASGPNVRAGFIEAPEIGLPQSPASAM